MQFNLLRFDKERGHTQPWFVPALEPWFTKVLSLLEESEAMNEGTYLIRKNDLGKWRAMMKKDSIKSKVQNVYER